MKYYPVLVALLAGALFAAVHPVHGQVERLDLEQLVRRCDNAVFGEIVSRRVFRAVDSLDGSTLYFTTLGLEGRSLVDGRVISVQVSYPGGWVSEEEGVWNSEAPRDDEVEVGTRVVIFYKWLDDLGGGVAGNMVYGMHAGVYRTVAGPKGRVVLGRGEGYAVRSNTSLDDLDAAVRRVTEER